MFFVKLLLVTAVVVTVMIAVKDGRILAETGLTGACVPTSAPAAQGEYWHECREGRISGWPDMSRHNCASHGYRGERELWRCPAALASDRTTG
jgi:hypothetical protein